MMGLLFMQGKVRFIQPTQAFQKYQIFVLLNRTQSRASHVSPFPVLPDDSDPNGNHERHFANDSDKHMLRNITIVDSAKTACGALKALVDAAEHRRYVSWSVQTWQPPMSNQGVISAPEVTLSAYAGDDFNFGNGPHLFVRSHDCNSGYMSQFRRYFTLDDAKHVWCNYSASLNALEAVNIRPKGFHRDVNSMADLIATKRPRKPTKSSGIHSLAEAFVPNQCRESMKSASLLKKPSFSEKALPWEQYTILPSAHIAADWIEIACYEAALLYTLHEKLCYSLRNVEIRGRNSPPEFKSQLRSALDVYDNFFRYVDEALFSVENNGVNINSSKLDKLTEHLRKQQAIYEEEFLKWASSRCPDAKYMDPQNNSQLRQLLFAPFTNTVNNAMLPSSKLIKVPNGIDRSKVTNDQKKRSRKREIELKGFGVTPFTLLKSGWPSTSTIALTQLANRIDNNEGLCVAIKNLVAANGVKLRANRTAKTMNIIAESEGRRKLRHHYDWDQIGVHHLTNGLKFDDDIRSVVTAQKGNKLLLIKYQRLRLWALAQLSRCSVLQERVESNLDITSTGSMKLFEGIDEMLVGGEIATNNSADLGFDIAHDSDCINSVKKKYPQAYELTRKLDSAFKYGGGVGGSALISSFIGLKGEKSRELRTRWYNGHPGVEVWHAEWRDMALRYGYAETMMGRKHILKLNNEKPRRNIERALTDCMRFVLGGSACEAVMGGVTRLVTNEQLHGLGWHVVMVDNDTIVLEGPEYSLETAIPVIRYDAMKPFSVNYWVKMPIAGAVVSSIADILPIKR